MILKIANPNSGKNRSGDIMEQTEKKAVDMKVVLSDGSETQLSQFWEQGVLALIFLRHFG